MGLLPYRARKRRRKYTSLIPQRALSSEMRRLFSKKRVGFLIAALVLFVLDTVFLIWNYGIAVSLIDLLFHGWIIYYLVSGTLAYYKLKKLENEPIVTVNGYGDEDGTDYADIVDSPDSVDTDNADGTDGDNVNNTSGGSDDPFDYSERDSQGL